MNSPAPPITVDVVIPARNAADTVEIAVRSVRSQTRHPGRVLLMDGRSSDRTADIARQAGAEIHRVDTGGVSRARKQGVAISQAQWIAFLDADDSWDPDWLMQAFHSLSRQPDAALLYGQARQIDEDGSDRGGPVAPMPSGDIYTQLLTRSIVTTSACLVRRSAFVELGGFNEAYSQGEDLDLWMRLASRWPCLAVPGLHVRYLRRADSAIHNPAFFMKSRDQGLRIVRAAFARRPVSQPIERQSLAHMYMLSAQRFVAHDMISQARRDLRVAIEHWPRCWQAWQLLALTACAPATRRQIRDLRSWLRQRSGRHRPSTTDRHAQER